MLPDFRRETATTLRRQDGGALTRGALFSVLSLPLLLPLMIFLIQGTAGVAEGAPEIVSSTVRAVLSMGGIMTIVSAALFPVVWSD